MSGNQVHSAVDKATDSTAFEVAARAGHTVSGCLHLLIAYIIVRLAFGSAGNADQSGALATLAGATGGKIALWVAAVAFLAMALWRLAETIVGPHPGESGGDEISWFDRGKALSLMVVYLGFAFSAVQFARGAGTSNGQQNASTSARMMGSAGGKALLILIALIVIAVGCYHVYKGVTKKFLDDLKVDGGGIVEPLGVVGYVAKGGVLAGAGALLVVAVLKSDPSKATGIDGAVKTLGEAPLGKFLLLVAAAGIAAYGLYSFVMARYARM